MSTSFRTKDIEIPTTEQHEQYLKERYGIAVTTKFPTGDDVGAFNDAQLKYHIDMFLPDGLEKDPVLFAVLVEDDKEYLGLSDYHNHVQKIIQDEKPIEVTGMDIRQLIRVSFPIAWHALNEYNSVGQKIRRRAGYGKERPSDHIETGKALRHASKEGQEPMAFRFSNTYIYDDELLSHEDNWFSEDNERLQREITDYVALGIV